MIFLGRAEMGVDLFARKIEEARTHTKSVIVRADSDGEVIRRRNGTDFAIRAFGRMVRLILFRDPF